MLKSSQEKGWILYMSEKANVYFSKEISPEKVLEMYQLLGKKLDGKVAIKLHSGEAGNQNFLKPEFWKPVIDYVGGTVVECNTAYEGERNTTAKHKKTLEAHGWSRYFKVDLLDAEGPDLELAIPNAKKTVSLMQRSTDRPDWSLRIFRLIRSVIYSVRYS